MSGKQRVGRRWVTSVVLGAAAAAAARGWASDFVVQSGDFTAGGSWSTGTVPGAGDAANINNGGTAFIHGAVVVPPRAADVVNVGALRLGVGASDNGMLTMDGGTLTVSPAGPLDYAANAVLVGDLGSATFTLNGGTVNLAGSDLVVARGGGPSSGVTASMSMGGGTVNLGGSLVIAPKRAASTPRGQVSITGGVVNVGQDVVVGQGSASVHTNGGSYGQLVVGGDARVTVGNSLGDGNAAGVAGSGGLALGAFYGSAGVVVLQDNAVVKALRLTGGQGRASLTIQNSAELHVVNGLGGVGTPGAAWNSFTGGGNNADGSYDGTEGDVQTAPGILLQNNGLLDVDANAAGRDPAHPELQGLTIAGPAAQVTIKDNARLVVRQRLVVGMPTAGTGVNLNGFDGQPQVTWRVGSNDAASVTLTGGLVSADQIVVSSINAYATLNAAGGRIETKAYDATYDPTANGGAGSATTSVNAIRVGMFAGTNGVVSVTGTGSLETGELSVGHYGTGRFGVSGGAGSVQVRDMVVQKFAGSVGSVSLVFTGPTQTVIRATNDIRINGGTLYLSAYDFPSGVYRWDVMEADSDHDGVGAIKGRFSTIVGGAGRTGNPPVDPRVFSVVYSPKKITVGFSYPGDADYSGVVNFNDLLTLARHYNQGGVQWTEGDFSGDGLVNFTDLLALARNYNAGSAAPAAVAGASVEFNADMAAAFAAAVPEPGVGMIVGLGVVGALRSRRRR